MIAAMNARTSSINRKDLVNAAAKSGLIAALALFVIGQLSANAAPIEITGSSVDNKTVSNTTSPIHAGGGMQIIPDYTFANAPAPKVIVIPAQSKPSEAMLKWIRESTKNTDVTMSVCTGAFVLARTGLLSGKAATTFHAAFGNFAAQFPDIHFKRGARFVEDGNLASAGGLSSGIDLALRVVERYYGRDVAQKTAYDMEYQGQGWMNPNSNQIYASAPVSTAEHPLCPVCGMDVDPKTAPRSVYKATTYYFCSNDDKKTFDAVPDKFVAADKKL